MGCCFGKKQQKKVDPKKEQLLNDPNTSQRIVVSNPHNVLINDESQSIGGNITSLPSMHNASDNDQQNNDMVAITIPKAIEDNTVNNDDDDQDEDLVSPPNGTLMQKAKEFVSNVIESTPSLITSSTESMARIVRIKKSNISWHVPKVFEQELKQLDCINVNDDQYKDLIQDLENDINQNIDEFTKNCLISERYASIKKGRNIAEIAIKFNCDKKGDNNYILMLCLTKESKEIFNNDHVIDIGNDNDNTQNVNQVVNQSNDNVTGTVSENTQQSQIATVLSIDDKDKDDNSNDGVIPSNTSSDNNLSQLQAVDNDQDDDNSGDVDDILVSDHNDVVPLDNVSDDNKIEEPSAVIATIPQLITSSTESDARTIRIKKVTVSKIVPLIFYQELSKLDCLTKNECVEMKQELQNEIDQNINEFINNCRLKEKYLCMKKERNIAEIAIKFDKDIRGNDDYIMMKCLAKESMDIYSDDHVNNTQIEIKAIKDDDDITMDVTMDAVQPIKQDIDVTSNDIDTTQIGIEPTKDDDIAMDVTLIVPDNKQADIDVTSNDPDNTQIQSTQSDADINIDDIDDQQSQSQSIDGSSSDHAIDNSNGSQWKCGRCTFLNQADIEKCQMCAIDRTQSNTFNTLPIAKQANQLVSNDKDNNVTAPDLADTPTPPAVDDNPSISGWSCEQCTFMNEPNVSKCEMCSFSKSQTNAKDNDNSHNTDDDKKIAIGIIEEPSAAVNIPQLITSSTESDARIIRIKKVTVSRVVPLIFYQQLTKLDCLTKDECNELKEELQNEINQNVDEFITNCTLREKYVSTKKGQTIAEIAVKFDNDIKGNNDYIMMKCLAKESSSLTS